jgi:hypothetical protein
MTDTRPHQHFWQHLAAATRQCELPERLGGAWDPGPGTCKVLAVVELLCHLASLFRNFPTTTSTQAKQLQAGQAIIYNRLLRAIKIMRNLSFGQNILAQVITLNPPIYGRIIDPDA